MNNDAVCPATESSQETGGSGKFDNLGPNLINGALNSLSAGSLLSSIDLQYSTLHYTTLHYTTLLYTTIQGIQWVVSNSMGGGPGRQAMCLLCSILCRSILG